MHTFHVVLSCNDSPPQASQHLLRKQLLHADVDWDVLQHVRIHVSETGAQVVLFVSGDFCSAQILGRELCLRALRGHPAFTGWSVDQCVPLPLGS